MKRKTIHTPEYAELINALASERKRLGLSQAEVAAGIGLLQSDISKIESLERKLDVITLRDLIAFYRISSNHRLKHHLLQLLRLNNDN